MERAGQKIADLMVNTEDDAGALASELSSAFESLRTVSVTLRLPGGMWPCFSNFVDTRGRIRVSFRNGLRDESGGTEGEARCWDACDRQNPTLSTDFDAADNTSSIALPSFKRPGHTADCASATPGVILFTWTPGGKWQDRFADPASDLAASLAAALDTRIDTIYRDLSILSPIPLSTGSPALGHCTCREAAQTVRETQDQRDSLPALTAQSALAAEASSGGKQGLDEREGAPPTPGGQRTRGKKEGPEASPEGEQGSGEREGAEAALEGPRGLGKKERAEASPAGQRGLDGREGAEGAEGGKQGLGKDEGAGSCSGRASAGMSSGESDASTKPGGDACRNPFAEIEDAGGSKSMESELDGRGLARADEVQPPDPVAAVPGDRPPSVYLPVHVLSLSFRNVAAEAKFGLEFARKRYWMDVIVVLLLVIGRFILGFNRGFKLKDFFLWKVELGCLLTALSSMIYFQERYLQLRDYFVAGVTIMVRLADFWCALHVSRYFQELYSASPDSCSQLLKHWMFMIPLTNGLMSIFFVPRFRTGFVTRVTAASLYLLGLPYACEGALSLDWAIARGCWFNVSVIAGAAANLSMLFFTRPWETTAREDFAAKFDIPTANAEHPFDAASSRGPSRVSTQLHTQARRRA